MVGVVHKVRFISSNNKKFNNYISYIGRDEATRNHNFEDFSLYNDYMGNPEKSGALFTKNRDFLSEKESEKLKELFSNAQENKSIMWQDVFSFDNEWLENQGLYDSKTHTVDEEKIRQSIRNTMNELIEKEKLPSLLWSASLHYNTDNIHVHIASVELDPSRERGKRKPKTLLNMKSKFVNNIIDRQDEYKKINDIIRKNIIETDKNFDLKKDVQIKKMVKDIILKLPKDKRQWHYNYNTMSEVRPILNQLTSYYIESFKKYEFRDLNNRLDKEENILKETYGESESFRYKDYKKNKINDLYTRMGNNILKEIKKSLADEKLNKKGKSHISDNYIIKDSKTSKENNKSESKNIGNKSNINISSFLNKSGINKLKKSLNKDFESIKNQRFYEKLENEIEYERY